MDCDCFICLCVAVPHHLSPLVRFHVLEDGVLSKSLSRGLRSNNLNINTQYIMLLQTERNNVHNKNYLVSPFTP